MYITLSQYRENFNDNIFKSSIVIHCDNESGIHVIDNLVTHNKMKHVELHCHYLRQLVQDKVVTLVYYRIDDQIVDVFTKPLSESKFIKFHSFLGLQEAAVMGGVYM